MGNPSDCYAVVVHLDHAVGKCFLLWSSLSTSQNVSQHVTQSCCFFVDKWVAAGRRFDHGDSETNIPIENVWRLLKYVFLERKVNLRAGRLLDHLVGIPGDEGSLAASVADYYRRRLRDHVLLQVIAFGLG